MKYGTRLSMWSTGVLCCTMVLSAGYLMNSSQFCEDKGIVFAGVDDRAVTLSDVCTCLGTSREALAMQYALAAVMLHLPDDLAGNGIPDFLALERIRQSMCSGSDGALWEATRNAYALNLMMLHYEADASELVEHHPVLAALLLLDPTTQKGLIAHLAEQGIFLGGSYTIVQCLDTDHCMPSVDGDHSLWEQYLEFKPDTEGVYFPYTDEEAILSDAFLTAPAVPKSAKDTSEIIPISSIEELQMIGNDPDYPLDGHYVLTQDIDASDTVNWNDGEGFDPIANTFSGIFDGQGHHITGLTINRGDTNDSALLKQVGSGGILRDVHLVDVDISGNMYVGALVARNLATVTGCSVSGQVNGDNYVGGLIGYIFRYYKPFLGYQWDAIVEDCYSEASVFGQYNTGGLVGVNVCGHVFDSSATGSVVGGSSIGGLVGTMSHGGILENSYAMGDVSGQQQVGGLVGSAICDMISNCHATGTVTGEQFVGGLVGWIKTCIIGGPGWDSALPSFTGVIESYSTGAVFGGNDIGGLVGMMSDDTISRSFTSGPVSGTENVGGLVGTLVHGEIDILQSFASGSVTGTENVGGLIGFIHHYRTIKESYSSGQITGDTAVGGLIGLSIVETNDYRKLEACFWDVETSGQSGSDGGTGLTTALMKTPGTFTDVDWDFDTVWDMEPGVTYPYLQALPYIVGGEGDEPETVLVPNMAGLSLANAHDALIAVGLTLVVTEAFSGEVPEGQAISQNPVAGTSVEVGSTVAIVVSLGAEPVDVPNVLGMIQAEAEATIEAAGLQVGSLADAYNDEVPEGQIISQNPAAGTSVVPGSNVYFVISLGPEPIVTVEVPDIVGMTQADATDAIEAADLLIGNISNAYNDVVAEGLIISQNPAASTSVEVGSSVSIVVSLGAEPVATVEVPNVVGMTRTQAEATIEAAGLLLGTASEMFSDSIPAGTIISQEPTSGTSVELGSVVTLVVSLGTAPPEVVVVPLVVNMTQSNATNSIEAAGLVISVTEAYSDDQPEGYVISQSPAAGTSVEVGSAVAIVVSLGPEQVPTIEVANVVGMTQTQAEAAIEAAGLIVGTITEEYNDEVAAGRIIDQSPAGGTTVELGTVVDLTVSLGSEPKSPAMCGTGSNTSSNPLGNVLLVLGLMLVLLRKSAMHKLT